MMKKITLLLVALLGAISLNAQTTYFSDNFDDEDISDWTLYDEDGDGNNWDVYQITDNQTGNPITPVSLISRSWQAQVPLTPDNWAVSPAIDLTGATGTITVSWLRQVNTAYPDEHYTLYVGTSSDIAVLVNSTLTKDENFTTTPSPETDTPKTITLDISSMAGQTIYLAFRHWDSNDADYISIDDLSVSGTLGVSENQIAGFKHFYNASTNDLVLSADQAFTQINLYNILGQQVISKQLSSTEETVNLSSLNTGVYLVNVEVNGKLATFKIVKR
ncbi:MAG TPA: choice-of-anchor J domain-containing protein [Flavobacteriaceae bacterium]|nr:choice-of-anchor J domain-containing protein [Flavobacteriaceae bacterium]